jgi:dimethyl sulfoxide reductase membrane subunit
MTTTTVARPESPPLPRRGVALLIVALVGIGVAWGFQLNQGLQVTGLNQGVVWGLYIAGFFTAAGAGAGLVALSVLGEFTPAISTVRRRSTLLLALACFVTAGLLIAMDLGDPLNTWRIATAGRFSSLLTWDFWALTAAFLLALAYLLVAWKETASTATTRTLAILAGLAALLLLVAESWMLSVLVARPLWGGGLTLINFLAAAAVATLAAGILAWPPLAPRFGKWLAVALGVSLLLLLAEVLSLRVATEPRAALEMNLLLEGSVSPLFWLHLIAGLLLPLGLLLWGLSAGRLPVAAVLALLGVLLHKLWLLVLGQTVPWLEMPQATYLPAWSEYLGLIGAVALTAALYVGARHFTQLHEE